MILATLPIDWEIVGPALLAGGIVGAGAAAINAIIAKAASLANESAKPDPNAIKPYQQDPGQLEGRTVEDVEKELDKTLVDQGHWTKLPSADGNGVRYIDGKGDLVLTNNGYDEPLQGNVAGVHQGPYVKIQPGDIRVPLAGNPASGG